MFKPLVDNEIKVMEATNSDLLDKTFEDLMLDWDDDWAMTFY